MQLTVKKQLNKTTEITFVFDAPDVQDVIKQASPVLEFDGVCPFNDSSEIMLRTRVTRQGHKYTEYVDLKDGNVLKWCQHKDNSGFFLDPKGWQPPYQGGN